MKNEKKAIAAKKEEKAILKKNEERETVWYKLFVKYLLAGLGLVLLYVIYDAELRNLLNNYLFWQKLVNVIFSVVGILGPSLVVASLFTYSIESNNFIDYIRDKIERVMIKKEFLDKLSDVDKREALKRILTPSNENFHIFSNIKNYFEETITKSMNLFDCTFKSNFTIDVDATIRGNKVCFDETLSQRMYKGKNGFDPIKFGFSEAENEEEFVSAQYINQNGECKQIGIKDFKFINMEEESGAKWKLYTYDIPKSIEDDFISVILKCREFGSDHWQLFAYKTMVPSEGIKVTVNCYDGLIIKEHEIFDSNKSYVCYLSDDKKKLEISTSQWISSGNGLTVLIAKEMQAS
jgi:hypothetical protein